MTQLYLLWLLLTGVDSVAMATRRHYTGNKRTTWRGEESDGKYRDHNPMRQRSSQWEKRAVVRPMRERRELSNFRQEAAPRRCDPRTVSNWGWTVVTCCYLFYGPSSNWRVLKRRLLTERRNKESIHRQEDEERTANMADSAGHSRCESNGLYFWSSSTGCSLAATCWFDLITSEPEPESGGRFTDTRRLSWCFSATTNRE